MKLDGIIHSPYIAIIGSGPSAYELTIEEQELLRENCYIIALNYVDAIKPNMRMWRDINISRWLNKHREYADCDLCSRRLAFKNDYAFDSSLSDRWLYDKVNVWEERDFKYTAWMALQMAIETNVVVMLIGFDCGPDKYSVYSANGEEPHKRENENQVKHLNELPGMIEADMLKREFNYRVVYNCSMNSKITCLQKKTISQVLLL